MFVCFYCVLLAAHKVTRGGSSDYTNSLLQHYCVSTKPKREDVLLRYIEETFLQPALEHVNDIVTKRQRLPGASLVGAVKTRRYESLAMDSEFKARQRACTGSSSSSSSSPNALKPTGLAAIYRSPLPSHAQVASSSKSSAVEPTGLGLCRSSHPPRGHAQLASSSSSSSNAPSFFRQNKPYIREELQVMSPSTWPDFETDSFSDNQDVSLEMDFSMNDNLTVRSLPPSSIINTTGYDLP